MAEIINLRQYRKRRAKDVARRKADANAADHGRSGAEKDLTEAREVKSEKDLDGHRLDDE